MRQLSLKEYIVNVGNPNWFFLHKTGTYCILMIIISLYDFCFSLNHQDIEAYPWALKSLNVKYSMKANLLKQNKIELCHN